MSDSAAATPESQTRAHEQLAATLRSLGYDIEPTRPGEPPGGSIVARRDAGDRAVLFSANAGGRFRAEITWRVGEWPSQIAISRVPARVVDGVTRTISVAGQLRDGEQFADVVAGLEALLPWADSAPTEGLHSDEAASQS